MRRFFAAATLVLSLLTCAAEINNLPKIKITLNKEKPEITPTGSVSEMSSSGLKLAANSAARKLAVPGKEFLWTPSEQTSRTTGGADIYATHLTSDGSAAVICERIGGFGNPNGLRVIVADTVSGKIIRATGTFEYDILYSKLLSDTVLFAVAAYPEKRGEEYCFITIDLTSEEVNASDAFTGIPDGVAVGKNQIFLLSTASKTVLVYDVSDYTLKAECRINNSEASGLEISPDGNVLAVYGKQLIELYNGKVHNGTLYLRKQYNYTGEKPTRCAMIDRYGTKIVFFAPESSATLLMNDLLITLPGITCGEVFATDIPNGTFLLENRVREFALFKLPRLNSVSKYSPRRMSPASKNDNTALFFLPGKKSVPQLLLADHRGNLWRLELVGKRGKKYPVLLVDETGIRKR